MRPALAAVVFALALAPAGAWQVNQIHGDLEHRATDGTDPAATRGDRHDVDGDKPRPMMSPVVSALMKQVLTAAGQKDWVTANNYVLLARDYTSMTRFDRFEVELVAGFVALNTGKDTAALTTYRFAIGSPFFPTALALPQQRDMLRNAMILSNKAGDFRDTIAFGNKLAALGPLDEGAALTLAMACLADKDYAAAQTLAQKVIDAALAAGHKPEDAALQIVANSKTALHR